MKQKEGILYLHLPIIVDYPTNLVSGAYAPVVGSKTLYRQTQLIAKEGRSSRSGNLFFGEAYFVSQCYCGA
jgi:hypothetical protein